MKKDRPLIFISNDDGYQAKGLNQLIEMLRPIGRLVVMAPDSARSGYSMAMTSDRPVTYKLVRKEEDVEVYSCSGTPVDCVKLAFHALFQDVKPDLVLAGINHGDNASSNVHYSGTMAVVIEGCLKAVPSIGFSSCNVDKNADFSCYESLVCNLCSIVLEKGLPKDVCLNVNFPLSPSSQVKVCKQDWGNWHQEWERCSRRDGSQYFWLSGYYESNEPDNEDSDRWALEHGYVAITPVTVDVTAYHFMDDLRNWIEK